MRRSLRSVVDDDVLLQLLTKPGSREPCKFEWRVESGHLKPGIRLDGRNWLLDYIDER